MHLNTRHLEKLRPPEIILSDRLVKRLEGPGAQMCIFLGIRLSRGPCHDDWCEPIKKAFAKIVDSCNGSDSQIVAEVRGVSVLIDGELYYSASKLRNRIVIYLTKRGQLKVEGLTAY